MKTRKQLNAWYTKPSPVFLYSIGTRYNDRNGGNLFKPLLTFTLMVFY